MSGGFKIQNRVMKVLLPQWLEVSQKIGDTSSKLQPEALENKVLLMVQSHRRRYSVVVITRDSDCC